MPYMVTSAGTPRVAPGQRMVARSEIARLLEQAELIVCEENTEVSLSHTPPRPADPEQPAEVAATRLQRWLIGMRNPVKSRT